VIQRWLEKLPNRMPLYIKHAKFNKVVNGVPTKISTKYAFFDLFDIIRRSLQMANNLESLYLLPRHGTYASELAHGSLYRENPCFTEPWVHSKLLAEHVMLGSDVEFKDGEGESRLGKVLSIFQHEDRSIKRVDIDAHTRRTPNILGALRQPCTHTCQDILKKGCAHTCDDCEDSTTCAQSAKLLVHVRPYRLCDDGETLVAMWDQELQIHPDNIVALIEVSMSGDKTKYRCTQAELNGDPVPINKLPMHPMDQFHFDFERLHKLPPDVPVLRLYLTYYYDVSQASSLPVFPLLSLASLYRCSVCLSLLS